MDFGLGGALGTYTVNRGDGIGSTDVRDDWSHTYASADNYAVRISVDFTRLFLVDGSSNNNKTLSRIDRRSSAQWPPMKSVFWGAGSVEK